MDKITIDEMSNSLFDYAQAVSDESLMTESKTIVGAINEVYGKQLIADSIGEPLNNTDTFTKMSNDINSLLSTFKTNMMNNGITVESGDRFKQLIDKIATMVEEGNGKGIQYITGNLTTSIDEDGYATISVDAGFLPNILIGYVKTSSNSNYICQSYLVYVPELRSNVTAFQYQGVNTYPNRVDGFNIDIENTKLTINNVPMFQTDIESRYYAIGVGEEDTTLRDSLASILQDEGVDVTEEDDMASLITKVDEEFDRKNANSGLNIINATELPNKVVNNQVCLITESFGKVYIANELSTSTLNEGDVYIMTTTTGYCATAHIITPISDISLNLSRIIQIKNGTEEKIDGYVGINGQWVPTDSLEFYLFKQGTGLHSSVGGFDVTNSEGTYSVSNNSISLTGYADFGSIDIQSKNPIDLTEYSKLEVKSSSSGYGGFSLFVGDKTLNLSKNSNELAILDISTINGLQYIYITKGSNYQNQSGTIYYIKLIKEFN